MTWTARPPYPVTKGAGQKTVTTAGTSVLLASSTIAAEVCIKALSTNTGKIYVKPSGIAGQNYSSNGFVLSASEAITFPVQENLNEVAIDSSVNSEGVSYIYIQVEGR